MRKIGVADFSSAEMKVALGLISPSLNNLRTDPRSVRKETKPGYANVGIFRDDQHLSEKITHNN